MSSVDTIPCWVCGATNSALFHLSKSREELTSDNFQITDSNYGETATIYRCGDCGFKFCPEVSNAVEFYEEMEDTGYVETEGPRRLQADKLVQSILKHKASGRLLDVGAGSGILVSSANDHGFEAEGVEPSKWLCTQATSRGLNIHHGVLPNPTVQGPFDVVTVVDVIEHVDDPVGLMEEVANVMSVDGIGMVVTPDVDSFFAKLLKMKWWHFRIAHIGYFNTENLTLALENAGLEIIAIRRPWWFFSGDYLFERICQYLPKSLRVRPPKFFSRITVPLNLFDSLTVVFKKGAKGP